jgi:hypothetical protein
MTLPYNAGASMTPDVNLSIPPTDARAAKGYAELHGLWKADEEAFNQGRHVSDAEFLIWMATVRLYLTTAEITIFDHASKDYSVKEFRAEKAAALATILWARRGLKVAKANGAIGCSVRSERMGELG